MIDDLIERVRGLTGPDREVDADIYIAFHIPAERVGRIDRLGGCVGWWPKDAPYESAVDVPSYTASLDAAVALVERVLPGAYRQINGPRRYLNIPTPVPARFRAEILRDEGSAVAWHDREPIALILALLSALKAKEARDGR